MTLHGRRLTLVLTTAEKNAALRALARDGLGNAPLLVGLNPGATHGTAKRWLPERYAELGRRLVSEHRAAVTIFMGEFLRSTITNTRRVLAGIA